MSDIKKLKEKFAKKKFICINHKGENVTHTCKKKSGTQHRWILPRAAKGYKWMRVERDDAGKPWEDGKTHWQEAKVRLSDYERQLAGEDKDISEVDSDDSSSDESTNGSDLKKRSSTDFIESDSDEDFNFKELYKNTSKDDADVEYVRATGKFTNDVPRKKKSNWKVKQ